MTKKNAEQSRLEAAFGFSPPAGQVHILSPEGVPVDMTRVSPWNRLGALCIDVAIQWALLLLVVILIVSLPWTYALDGTVYLVFILFSVFMRLPYFLLQEYLMRGQTLGKRICGLRVVDEAGGRLRLSALIVRNVSREVEVVVPSQVLIVTMFGAAQYVFGWATWPLLAWLLIVAIFPFTNKDRKRLGDMLAGTVVVEQHKPKMLKDPAKAKTSQDFKFTRAQLAAYGEFEVQVLQRVLAETNTPARMEPVVKAITKKIKYTGRVPKGREREFLGTFYQAQRRYLEERLLVGKRKTSKVSDEADL